MLIAHAPAAAATLVLSKEGKLAGARGALVEGLVYDVTFQQGSCAVILAPCDLDTGFFFDSAALALAAAQALLDQVFVDRPEGTFDSEPPATEGCGAECWLMVPYLVHIFDASENAAGLWAMYAFNAPMPDIGFGDETDQVFLSSEQWVHFAVFSTPPIVPDPSVDGDGMPPVPLPGAGWLMLAGLGALVRLGRRKEG